MHVPKQPFVFQFKIKKPKTNFMYLNGHSFSKIKMKKKNRIEDTFNILLDLKLIQECYA